MARRGGPGGVGVAAVELADGTIVGRRAKPFDYTGRKVVGAASFKALVRREMTDAMTSSFGESGRERWRGARADASAGEERGARWS